MFFIYGTDAPIYHYPIVTSIMAVVNIGVHLMVTSLGIDILPYILAFGDGFHPLQWLTHNFLHAGWLHLIGNMIFLFPFGLIVEGKIGWLRMLILYLAIGVGQGFTQQLIMLPSDQRSEAQRLVDLFNDPENPMDEETREALLEEWREDLRPQDFGSLGASAVIFGLLAVCVIWAPVNEFNVYFRWSLLISAPDGGDREWSVATVCGIFVVKEFFMFLMMGMPISSEALHLNGFVIGGMFGLAMLYLGYVDCEGYDLISIWSGSKFKAQRVIDQEERERQAAIEAALPSGPPQAVVPRMPHQLSAVPLSPSPSPAKPIQSPPPQQPVSRSPTFSPGPRSSDSASASTLDDLALPDFDDGTAAVDPMVEAAREIETMIASGKYTAAVRQLAQFRKQNRYFVVSARSMGRLAEGLVKGNHIKPAMTVLSIGCDSHPAYESRWRIRIASLELTSNRDPIAAIKQLKQIDKETLDSTLRKQYVKVAESARRMAGR